MLDCIMACNSVLKLSQQSNVVLKCEREHFKLIFVKRKIVYLWICWILSPQKIFKSANLRICDLRNFFAYRPPLQQKKATKKETLKHGVKSIGQTARGGGISIQQWKVILSQCTDKIKRNSCGEAKGVNSHPKTRIIIRAIRSQKKIDPCGNYSLTIEFHMS